MSKRLNLEEIKENLLLWRKNEDERGYIQLVMHNQHLVRYIANRYISCGLSKEDVLSAGKLGLIKAINEFNYNDTDIVYFRLYALKYIESQIQQELQLDYEQRNLLESNLSNIDNQTMEIELSNIFSKQIKAVLQTFTSSQREFVILEYLRHISVDDIENILNVGKIKLENSNDKGNQKVK